MRTSWKVMTFWGKQGHFWKLRTFLESEGILENEDIFRQWGTFWKIRTFSGK